MDNRATFSLSDRALKRLEGLQEYYRDVHQLDLSASAVVRRAIDSLYMELGLAQEVEG